MSGVGVRDLPLGEQAVTKRQREEGVWGVRHSRARQVYGCAEGPLFGPECLIFAGETYWRFYGVMAEAFRPHLFRVCERHRQEWVDRYGE